MLANKTLKIIDKIASKYTKCVPSGSYDKSDLYQEGCIAALSASQSFDPKYGVQLQHWQVKKAVYAIQKYVSKYYTQLSGRLKVKDKSIIKTWPVQDLPRSLYYKLTTTPRDQNTNLLVEDLMDKCSTEGKELLELRFFKYQDLFSIAKLKDTSPSVISVKINRILGKLRGYL